MAPTASVFYPWDEEGGESQSVLLDCLLPTGILIQLTVDKDSTLAEIKEVP